MLIEIGGKVKSKRQPYTMNIVKSYVFVTQFPFLQCGDSVRNRLIEGCFKIMQTPNISTDVRKFITDRSEAVFLLSVSVCVCVCVFFLFL